MSNLSSLSNPARPRKRQSGIYTVQGWERLQDAKEALEIRENDAYPLTMIQVSQRSFLSPNTLTKVFARKVAVDLQTLELCFQVFGLELTPSDYFKPSLLRTAKTVPGSHQCIQTYLDEAA